MSGVPDSRTLIDSVLQSARVDVLVHLLALEQLANVKTVDVDLSDARQNQPQDQTRLSPQGNLPQSLGAREFFERAHRVDWVGRSHAFSSADGEPSVTEQAAKAQDGEPLTVRFASGGRLVSGAMDAALALYYGLPIERSKGSAQMPDRSITALRHAGWSNSDLRALLHKWAAFDPSSAIVIIRLAADEADQAQHEITCRYDIVHCEYDFITEADQIELQLEGRGSVRTVFLRGDADSLSQVGSRYPAAVIGCFAGDFSTVPTPILWSPIRQEATDAGHEQRLRKLRRKELATQLLDRARRR